MDTEQKVSEAVESGEGSNLKPPQLPIGIELLGGAILFLCSVGLLDVLGLWRGRWLDAVPIMALGALWLIALLQRYTERPYHLMYPQLLNPPAEWLGYPAPEWVRLPRGTPSMLAGWLTIGVCTFLFIVGIGALFHWGTNYKFHALIISLHTPLVHFMFDRWITKGSLHAEEVNA